MDEGAAYLLAIIIGFIIQHIFSAPMREEAQDEAKKIIDRHFDTLYTKFL